MLARSIRCTTSSSSSPPSPSSSSSSTFRRLSSNLACWRNSGDKSGASLQSPFGLGVRSSHQPDKPQASFHWFRSHRLTSRSAAASCTSGIYWPLRIRSVLPPSPSSSSNSSDLFISRRFPSSLRGQTRSCSSSHKHSTATSSTIRAPEEQKEDEEEFSPITMSSG